jgi:hypothetical protein
LFEVGPLAFDQTNDIDALFHTWSGVLPYKCVILGAKYGHTPVCCHYIFSHKRSKNALGKEFSTLFMLLPFDFDATFFPWTGVTQYQRNIQDDHNSFRQMSV